MSIIKLRNTEVEIKDELTWWDTEEIKTQWMTIGKYENIKGENASMSIQADNIKTIKLKLFELCILSIKKDGQNIPFTQEWVKTLNVEDGKKLNEEIEKRTGGFGGTVKKN